MKIAIAVVISALFLASIVFFAHRKGHLDVSGGYVYISWMTSSDPTDIDKETVAIDFSIPAFSIAVLAVGTVLTLAIAWLLNRIS